MNKIKIGLILIALLFTGCLKEMKEKEITFSVKEEDPIKVLQSLTVETKKTEVMILGIPHLKLLQKNIDKNVFDSLLITLKNFAPNQIGIQTLSPHYIQYFSLLKNDFNNIINDDIQKAIELGKIAQKKLKVDFNTALQSKDSLITQIQKADKKLMDIYRIKLIMNMVASFDIYSAALQWSYIPESIKLKNKDLPEQITKELNQILNSPDEINTVAISLAESLGLQKLVAIDDQQDKDIYNRILPDLTKQIIDDTLYNRVANSEVYKKTDKIFKQSYERKNLLPYIRYINSQEYAIKDAEAQWGIFYKLNLESKLDRTRAALWEVRNLNITSNIRRATSLNPGMKMLVIVDPSHKPFLEAYLSSLGDIKIVQFNSLVKK